MLRSLACALLAFGLGACSSSPAGVPDAGVLGSCSGDAECGAGFKCDRQQRRCVCTGDQACPGGFCNAFTGLCVASVPGCTDDSVCAKTEYCDRGVRSCKPLSPLCGSCKTDGQCGASSKCAAHPSYPNAGTFCVPLCASADAGGGCANGLVCLARDTTPTADKLCYPSAGACGISNACTPDSRKPCAQDSDCPDASQVCDASLRACVAKVRSCQAGDACDPQQRICVHACAGDSDCTLIEGKPGFQCVANACVQRALCTQDSDCTDGQNCQANPDGSKSCAAGCVVNGDCPLGQSCNRADPKHPKCAQGCSGNTDCPLNQICSQGACTSTLSGANGSCSQTCQATQVCSIASFCNPSSCCAAAVLDQQCHPTDSTITPSTDVCGRCDKLAGCPFEICTKNCFPMAVKSCATDADCSAFPRTVCTPQKVCQTMVHALPCTSNADCPWKGFLCRPRSLFCGSGATDQVCVPDAQSAQAACVLGHP